MAAEFDLAVDDDSVPYVRQLLQAGELGADLYWATAVAQTSA